jgi:hypothetical protein
MKKVILSIAALVSAMCHAQGFQSENIYKYVFNSEKEAVKAMKRGTKMDEAHRSAICQHVDFQIHEGLVNVETGKSANYIKMRLSYVDSFRGPVDNWDELYFSIDTSYELSKDVKYHIAECDGQQIMFLDHKKENCLVRARALVDGKIEVVFMFYEKY